MAYFFFKTMETDRGNRYGSISETWWWDAWVSCILFWMFLSGTQEHCITLKKVTREPRGHWELPHQAPTRPDAPGGTRAVPVASSGAGPQVDSPRALLRCCLLHREAPSPTPVRTKQLIEFAGMTLRCSLPGGGAGPIFGAPETPRPELPRPGPVYRQHLAGGQAACCPGCPLPRLGC